MPCQCCGTPRPMSPKIIGIQRDLKDEPALILFNCPCGTTRAVKWAHASRAQRVEAFLAEMSGQPKNEMTAWEG